MYITTLTYLLPILSLSSLGSTAPFLNTDNSPAPKVDPYNTHPLSEVPNLDQWDTIKTMAGAVKLCTEPGLTGFCASFYNNERFGVCADLLPPLNKNISSLELGQGGQCVFWAGKKCGGYPRYRWYDGKETTRLDVPAIAKGYDNKFQSFSCWGDTKKIKGM